MRLFARFSPKFTEKIEKLVEYANVKKNPRELAGMIIFISLVIAVVAFVALFLFVGWIYSIPVAVVIYFVVPLIFQLMLVLKADKRASQAEEALPDALQLMATNLRAGLTTDKALLVSAREEFGVLNEEFKRVAKEIAVGKEITESLKRMSERIHSDLVERTLSLIIFGIISGGELASLLEESAASLRQQSLTRKQIHASVLMYTIFIIVAVAAISPLLFGLSSVLTETMQETIGSIEAPPPEVTSQVPLSISPVDIDVGLIRIFIIILLVVSAILSSLVLGLISKGNEKAGLKYIPILMIISLVVFFVVRTGIVKLLEMFF
ncbi:MAG: type II secretion system F family protein [archaeon]|nr:MAG: type II secretion system F family protein [archaeon]